MKLLNHSFTLQHYQHDEQIILSLELALFHLLNSLQLQTTLERSCLHASVKVTSYLFIIFVDLSRNV
jgi:hypothetical protein